jgi:hypothetical protein
MGMTRRHLLAIGLAALAGWGLAATARGDEPRLGDFYGFLPPELYKLDDRIAGLLVRDLDGDGTADIAVANNARSRIDLLLTTPGPAEDDMPFKAEANVVPSSRRMRLKTIPVNKEVVSLQAGDFDGDKKVDLAFYGTPAEVVVLYGDGAGNFGAQQRKVNTGEGIPGGTALAVGDLNRDGRDDLVLAAPHELVTILQREDGRLAEPERLPHTAAQPGLLKAIDLDGDGGDDLALLDGESGDPIRVRFSTEGGRLGPEQRFATEQPRAVAYYDLDGKPGAELLAVESGSGRAKVFTLEEEDDDDSERRGRLIFFPMPSGDARGRSLALGDVDGDKKVDVIVSDPSNAQFLVYLQGEAGLVRSQTFPNLAGGKAVAVADLDGDGRGEVVVLSEAEKQIGRSVFEDGRLTFPAPLPISGDPVSMALGDLDGDKRPEILYVSRGGAGNNVFSLRALKREASGSFIPYRWGQADAVELAGLSGNPPAMRALDVNRDGLVDVLVFKPFGSPMLLLGRGGGEPPAASGGSLGPLVGASPAGISMTAPGEAALLVAQNTFARSVVLNKDGQWEVKDQFNAGRGSAQVIGAAALDTDGDGVEEVVLLDKASKSLLFLEQRDTVYKPAGSLSVGAFDFEGTHVADLDGDGRDDLLLAGSDKFGVVLTGRKGLNLKQLASYESSRKDAVLGDLIAGDLNADGRPDLVISDVGEHALEVVAYLDGGRLQRAVAFKIFESKSFRDADSLVEPREMDLGDVDGDGRTDIVLIVHDRVLVYRQDPGEKPGDEGDDSPKD